MRGILPMFLLPLLITGCGSSGGGGSNPPTLDMVYIGLDLFRPSNCNRYQPGLKAGQTITFIGIDGLEGMTYTQTAANRTVAGVPGKEITFVYRNGLGQVILTYKYTYAVDSLGNVRILNDGSIDRDPTLLVMKNPEDIVDRDDASWVDFNGDHWTTSYPKASLYGQVPDCMNVTGPEVMAYYDFLRGHFIETVWLDHSGAWVLQSIAPDTPATNG